MADGRHAVTNTTINPSYTESLLDLSPLRSLRTILTLYILHVVDPTSAGATPQPHRQADLREGRNRKVRRACTRAAHTRGAHARRTRTAHTRGAHARRTHAAHTRGAHAAQGIGARTRSSGLCSLRRPRPRPSWPHEADGVVTRPAGQLAVKQRRQRKHAFLVWSTTRVRVRVCLAAAVCDR